MTDIDETLKLYRKGRMSRRAFLASAAAAGLSLPFARALAEQAGSKGGPSKGGHFRQAITGGNTTDTLDPGQAIDMYMFNVSAGQLRNRLTEIATDNSLIGELAVEWEPSSDASTWTFQLRRGVEFHNGKTLDARDVVDSINHHRGKDSKSAAKGLVDPIRAVKADGKHTVVVELESGNADFPWLLSDSHLAICPSNGDGTIDWQSGVGTGGYVLETFEPGQRTVTKRNPNYWKEGRAHFDKVTTLNISDVTARQNALRNGQVDAVTRLDLKTVQLMEQQAGLRPLITAGNQHYTLPMLTDTEPFTDNNVRLAIKYAIDRELWVNQLLFKYGHVGNDNPLGPVNRFQTEFEQRPYDPDRAKHYLKKAGYDKLDVTLHVSGTAFDNAVSGAQLVQQSAARANINVKVAKEPPDAYWGNVWQKVPWCASYWAGRPTADWLFSLVYASGANWNETHWDNERFNKLLKQARAELDPSKRQDMYTEMQQLIRNEGGTVIPAFVNFVDGLSDSVATGPKVAANLEFDGHRAPERWWFSDAAKG